MKPLALETLRQECKTISKKDTYFVRSFQRGSIDAILDIGANMGLFSYMMRFLHPEARIICIEPSSKFFKLLKNPTYIFNIELLKLALGNGNIIGNNENNFTLPVPVNNHNNNGIESKTLDRLLEISNISYKNKYMIKIDCEGYEKYLLNHKPSEDTILNSIQTSLEIHYIPIRRSSFIMTDQDKEDEKFYLPFSDYNNWINDCFSKTHHIHYYNSMRRRGYGHYCIRRKDFPYPIFTKRS